MTRKGRRAARRAYHARMQARLERVPVDVAYLVTRAEVVVRAEDVVLAAIVAEDARRSATVTDLREWSVRA